MGQILNRKRHFSWYLKIRGGGDIKVYDAKLEGEEFTADDIETVSIREMVEECGEKATIQRKILKREVEKIAAELGKKATEAHAVNQ